MYEGIPRNYYSRLNFKRRNCLHFISYILIADVKHEVNKAARSKARIQGRTFQYGTTEYNNPLIHLTPHPYSKGIFTFLTYYEF